MMPGGSEVLMTRFPFGMRVISTGLAPLADYGARAGCAGCGTRACVCLTSQVDLICSSGSPVRSTARSWRSEELDGCAQRAGRTSAALVFRRRTHGRALDTMALPRAGPLTAKHS